MSKLEDTLLLNNLILHWHRQTQIILQGLNILLANASVLMDTSSFVH